MSLRAPKCSSILMEVVALKSSSNSQKTNKEEQEFELVLAYIHTTLNSVKSLSNVRSDK